MATVRGASGALSGVLTPPTLALMARNMIRRGEDLHLISMRDDGTLALIPVGSHDVQGGPDPASWWIRADVYGPSGNLTRIVPYDGVTHAMYAVDPARPWAGVSPLGWAAHTGKLAGGLEVTLANEAGAPSAQVIPIPEDGRGDDEDADDDSEDPLSPLRADILAAKGNVMLVETTGGAWGFGKDNAPRQDWKQTRVGADFPDVLRVARADAAIGVATACGVPPALLSPSSEGTSQRESLRRFAHIGLQPLAAILVHELRLKLDAPGLALDFSPLMASDLAGRARAVGAFVKAGMNLDAALQRAGLS